MIAIQFVTRPQAAARLRHIGPGDDGDPVELVDVKDVARFLILAIERTLNGTFNLTGKPMRFREFLEGCNAAIDSDAQFERLRQCLKISTTMS